MRTTLLLLLFCLPMACKAQSNLWQQAQDQNLAQEPAWLNLLHLERSRDWDGPRFRAHVIDPSFYLAPDGAENPAAELKATLAMLQETPPDNPEPESGQADSSSQPVAQCRYLARRQWLEERLNLESDTFPQWPCPNYRKWRELVQAERVVLIFPSYYLNSPSSMFGHTLLRLDGAQSGQGQEWLSFAVNFGAEVNPNDNSIFYAFKGLTGGYPGQFKIDYYFKKIQEYNRDENRDIWEFPLRLSAAETERLIRHLWELQGINFGYYFFDENCSYRVLQLLQVARPGLDLTSNFALTAIPIDTVRAAQAADLVDEPIYRPAKGSVLKQHLRQIPPDWLAWVEAIAENDGVLDEPQIQSLAPQQRAQLINAAYKLLRFRQIGKARDEAIAARSYRLLQAVNQHSEWIEAEDSRNYTIQSPDRSHGSRRLSAGLWRGQETDYLSLGLRLSLHSLEERQTGFLPGAQINLGNLELRIEDDGRLDLERLDLVDIFSLSPRNRFFSPLSWKILTGLERAYADGHQRRVAHVTGGAGFAWPTVSSGQIHALAQARLEHNQGFDQIVEPAAGILLGGLQPVLDSMLRWELSGEKFANGLYRARAVLHHNWPLSPRHALALHIGQHWNSANQEPQFGLRYQYYY